MFRTRDKDGGRLVTVKNQLGHEIFSIGVSCDDKIALCNVFHFHKSFHIDNAIYSFQLVKEHVTGKLCLKVNLTSNNDNIITNITSAFLNNGQWHYVTLTRYRNVVHLSIDKDNEETKGIIYIKIRCYVR